MFDESKNIVFYRLFREVFGFFDFFCDNVRGIEEIDFVVFVVGGYFGVVEIGDYRGDKMGVL